MNFDGEIFDAEDGARFDGEQWDELCGWDDRSYGIKLRYSFSPTTKTRKSYNTPKSFQITPTKQAINLKKPLLPKPKILHVQTPKKLQILRKPFLLQLPQSPSPLDSLKIMTSLVASYKQCKINLRNTYHLKSQTPALLIRRSNKYT